MTLKMGQAPAPLVCVVGSGEIRDCRLDLVFRIGVLGEHLVGIERHVRGSIRRGYQLGCRRGAWGGLAVALDASLTVLLWEMPGDEPAPPSL
jgi:hypothetical protein